MAVGINRIQVTSAGLTTASTAYAAADQVGTIMTFAGCAVGTGGTGAILSIDLVDETSLASTPFRVWVFRSSITLAADNAAFSISDADREAMVGGGPYELGPIIGMQAAGSGQGIRGLYDPYDCAATSLFVALQAISTRTFFGAVGDLKVTLTVNVLT